MTITKRDYFIVIALGLASGALWVFGFKPINLFIYDALGRPLTPTTGLLVAVIVQSILMGLIPAVIAAALTKSSRICLAGPYLLSTAMFIITSVSLMYGGRALLITVQGFGLWLFIASNIIGYMVTVFIKNRLNRHSPVSK